MAPAIHLCAIQATQAAQSELRIAFRWDGGWFNLAPSVMDISNLIKLAVSLLLEVWLVILLFKRRIRALFPVFLVFVLYATLITAARLLTSFHYRTYFFVFWWTEAFLLLLSLAALHEVFYWMFEGFYRLWWFRLFYYGTVALVLGIAVRNAFVSPPVQAHRVISLILDVNIGANFVLAGIVALFAVLQRLLVIEFRRQGYGIIVGFGLSSAGSLLGYFARSGLGTKAESFARYSSAVGYILGVAIWVASFIRPEPEDKWEPPMSPERMMEEVQGYLGAIGISKKRQ